MDVDKMHSYLFCILPPLGISLKNRNTSINYSHYTHICINAYVLLCQVCLWC